MSPLSSKMRDRKQHPCKAMPVDMGNRKSKADPVLDKLDPDRMSHAKTQSR